MAGYDESPPFLERLTVDGFYTAAFALFSLIGLKTGSVTVKHITGSALIGYKGYEVYKGYDMNGQSAYTKATNGTMDTMDTMDTMAYC
jgi:hypothetical protein